MEQKDRFHFEDPCDSENEVTIYANQAGGLYISVANEVAWDSYNHTVDCNIAVDEAAAIRLRDYLNNRFPKTKPEGAR